MMLPMIIPPEINPPTAIKIPVALEASLLHQLFICRTISQSRPLSFDIPDPEGVYLLNSASPTGNSALSHQNDPFFGCLRQDQCV